MKVAKKRRRENAFKPTVTNMPVHILCICARKLLIDNRKFIDNCLSRHYIYRSKLIEFGIHVNYSFVVNLYALLKNKKKPNRRERVHARVNLINDSPVLENRTEMKESCAWHHQYARQTSMNYYTAALISNAGASTEKKTCNSSIVFQRSVRTTSEFVENLCFLLLNKLIFYNVIAVCWHE